MAIDQIHLRKLIRLMMAKPNLRTRLLRADLREEQKKQAGDISKGGDFYSPFWAAAKRHARGEANILIEVSKLIAANNGRRRLYDQLGKRFQEWWSEKRAWRNDPFAIDEQSIRGRLNIPGLGLSIKIESTLTGLIGDNDRRLVYPYFSEDPRVSGFGARIGLYILSEAFPELSTGTFRILDVLRSTSFSVTDVPFTEDEEAELHAAFDAIRTEYNILSREYALDEP